ncbi:adenylate/guanylate cyclase domain-containing protein [Microvirga puerhi]|uniref:Adenylate/guanylate cyclase domain-containing protein n=1 Tax=Microvirga puerhi TaxID=2876078 RepID=A0ABS7VTC8_9HYPH|nr:adenylate/guanylate cyclase domain-containing protein [Microvirga puerhi]
MGLKDFKEEVSSDVETILGKDFRIEVTNTQSVPHASDSGITFPNLDEKIQKCKIIETAVLYIDIRRSTELNLEHKPQTVAKLYSAFVRAMTQCATYYNGHVRGIIGDRVMVIFNPSTSFTDAVETAILMNSVAQYVINRHFTKNEVSCGIGLDYGRMLATKTGIRRHGAEKHNYRSLVWLGRPANVASKLTDLANKTSYKTEPVVQEGLYYPLTDQWSWIQQDVPDFFKRVEPTYLNNHLVHINNYFRACCLSQKTTGSSTPPILMTEAVYKGYKAANPKADTIANNWWRSVSISVPGYSGTVYGGDVIKKAFKDP